MIVDGLTDEMGKRPIMDDAVADNIVICGETGEEVERRLKSWRCALEGRGMKVGGSKTEYLCINGRSGDEAVKMEDTEVRGVEEFGYLGSTVRGGGGCEREVKRRVRAEWSGWRGVPGVTCDRRLPAGVEGKVYSSVVGPSVVCGLGTVAVAGK